MPLLICPNCEVGMKEVTRNGVQIDVCPDCRAVWLDRGEMEKLLSAAREAAEEMEREYQEPRYQRPPEARQRGYGAPPYHKRPKSKLEKLFDIFD